MNKEEVYKLLKEMQEAYDDDEDCFLMPGENCILLQYIKQLQQENKQLKEENEEQRKLIEYYKNKEIEQINKNMIQSFNDYNLMEIKSEIGNI